LLMGSHTEQLHEVVHLLVEVLQLISLALHQLEGVLRLPLENLDSMLEIPSACAVCGTRVVFL
jgi:hypothetical protein